jgi:hypothetical protein
VCADLRSAHWQTSCPNTTAQGQLLAEAGRYRPVTEEGQGGQRGCGWLSRRAEGEPIALWLFGRRDPDDYYSRGDIELLATLASQSRQRLTTHGSTSRRSGDR